MPDLKDNPIVNYAAQQAKTQAATQINTLNVVSQIEAATHANEAQIESVGDYTEASATAAAVTDSFKQETTNNNARMKADLGTDPNAANYRLSRLASMRESAFEGAVQAEKVIAAKKSMTLLNNPLGYIQAQFTLPADIAVYNHYANTHNLAESEYDGIVSSTTSSAQMNNATEATMSAALSTANQEKVVASGQSKIAEIREKNAQFNVQGVQALQGMNEADLRNAASAVSVYAEVGRIQLQREQFAATQEQRLLGIQMRTEQMKNITEKNAAEDMDVENYNRASARLGGATLSKTAILSYIKRGRPDVLQMVRYGEDIAINGGKAEGVIISNSPAQAAALFATQRLLPSGTVAPTMKWVVDTAKNAAGDPLIGSLKDPNARLGKIDEIILGNAVKQMKSIDDSKEGNLYASAPPASVIASSPIVNSDPFVQAVIVPMAKAAPNQPISAPSIYAAAAQTVREDPTALESVASGLTKYYSGVVAYNNQMKGYLEHGLPKQAGYMAQLPTGFFGGSQTLDLTNQQVVKKLLMTAAIQNVDLRAVTRQATQAR